MRRGAGTELTIVVTAIAATVILIGVYFFAGLKFLVPAVILLVVTALVLFFRDIKTSFFYLLVTLLPVFIARYLGPIPEVDHPGLLNVPVLYAYEVPLFVFLFLWTLELVSGRGAPVFLPPLTMGLGLLFVPAVASLFTAIDYTYGVFELVRMGEMFLFFLVVANYLRTDRQLGACLGILGVGIILQAVLALIQFMWPWKAYDFLSSLGIYMGISHARPYDPTSPVRACGTTGYCNSLAGFLELVVPVFVAVYFYSPVAKRWRGWFFLLFGMAAAALVVTYSRGGMLGMGVAMVSLLILGYRRFPALGRRAWRISAVVGVQLAVILALFSKALLIRLSFYLGQSLSMEDDVRVALVRDAFEMIRHHPVTGVGLNNFPEAFSLYEVSGLKFDINFPVHNTWLLIAAEQGLLGLGIFLIFMLYIYRTVRRALRDVSPFRAAVAVGLGAGLIGWAVHNLVAPLYQNWLVNRITFIFVLGVLAALPRLRAEDRTA
jgi:O-antigen ligase